MTTAEEQEPILEQALPEAPLKRDLFGNFCFYLHFAAMIYIVSGWLAPWRPALVFYAFFMPLVVTSWRLNKDSCVLNNLESYFRTGNWRDPENKEEGAWLLGVVRNLLGWNVTAGQINLLTYAAMTLFWLLGLGHLFFRTA